MADLFQERYRELPAFKQILDFLANVDVTMSLEEMTTRIMMMQENGLNWDTLCQNCGVLMDDNYAKYSQIEQLKEDLAYAENEARDLQRELDHWEHMNEENRI
jgi:hypothetical protein